MRHLLTQRCDIYHWAEMGREDGTPAYSEVPAATDVPCRLSGGRSRTVNGPAGVLIVVDRMLYLPPGTDVRAGDKVVVDGEAYIAHAPYCPGGHHLEVPLERFQER